MQSSSNVFVEDLQSTRSLETTYYVTDATQAHCDVTMEPPWYGYEDHDQEIAVPLSRQRDCGLQKDRDLERDWTMI